MRVRYYIDPETDEPHIFNHDVVEREVEDVLRRPSEDRPGRHGSRVVLGATEDGRHLRVTYVPDEDGRACFVITAYELTGKPLEAYRRRRKRKHRQ